MRKKMKFQFLLNVFLLLPIVTQQRSNYDSLSYIGAVVEYSPIVEVTGKEDISVINADNYIKFINRASEYNVDIIVFPESSLSIQSSKNVTVSRSEAASYIPGSEENIAPCSDISRPYKYSLKSISCAAKEHQIYVVINHLEKVDCVGEECPEDGLLIFNTNVVFDREGRVIARYRKYNLFKEFGTNITSEPIPTTFETDFGVKFGTFICFDILYEKPTLNLTRDLGITDIVYSAHWFSELPYLISVEAQSAWAYVNDVNLLAAGYNNPDTASGGSGIYIGKQGHAKVINEHKRSNILLVSEIPKVIKQKRLININPNMQQVYEFRKLEINTSEMVNTERYPYLIDRLSPYKTELIDVRQRSYNKILCDHDFCCDFKLKINIDESSIRENSTYYRYRLSVFNGVRTFSQLANGGIKSCGIISCIDDKLSGCIQLLQNNSTFVTPTIFESIEIKIENINYQRTFFMPITLDLNLMPMNTSEFKYTATQSSDKSTHLMISTKPTNKLLTFAIFGRNFERDGSNTSIVLLPSYFLLVSIVVCNNLYLNIMKLFLY